MEGMSREHARLYYALMNEVYREPPSQSVAERSKSGPTAEHREARDLSEHERRGDPPLPEGVHERLMEALVPGWTAGPKEQGVHERLRKALIGGAS